MQANNQNARQREGVVFAVLAAIIWSGNFIIARGVSAVLPPISLNFYRWLTASVCILPFAWKSLAADRHIVVNHKFYFFCVSLTGIAVFNTFVYIAGHYTSAINLALIGTTSSPVFAVILAAVFLKEKIRPLRIAGMVFCLCGILVLLSRGSLEKLRAFSFDEGDWWILLAGFFFAVYSTLVKIKPAGVSPNAFLAVTFISGTIILFPFFLFESYKTTAVLWDLRLAGVVAYLGIGASVLSYLFWNRSIGALGSSRTALFGNLIPMFSTLEAVIILHEKMEWVHLYSGILIITGLIVANLKRANTAEAVPQAVKRKGNYG